MFRFHCRAKLPTGHALSDMIAFLQIVRLYFTALSAASILLMIIRDYISSSFMFLFNIFAIPTAPLVKIGFFLTNKIFGKDLSVLFSVLVSSILYAAIANFGLKIYRSNGS